MAAASIRGTASVERWGATITFAPEHAKFPRQAYRRHRDPNSKARRTSAAPLATAIKANNSRPRLACNNRHRMRQNIRRHCCFRGCSARVYRRGARHIPGTGCPSNLFASQNWRRIETHNTAQAAPNSRASPPPPPRPAPPAARSDATAGKPQILVRPSKCARPIPAA